MEMGRCGEIQGSVLPGIKVTMRFDFMLRLVLVTSDCEITAECGVKKSVNTSAVHICCVQKNAKCDAYGLFCGTDNHNRRAEDWPEVGFFQKEFLPTPTILDQTLSNYPGLVVVAVLVQNILE